MDQLKVETEIINKIKWKIVRESEDKGTEKLKKLHEDKMWTYKALHIK